MTYTIAYNLSEFSSGLFLPSAYIVEVDAYNTLTYIKKKATEENLKEFQLILTPTHKKLLDIITLLSPKSLEKKYNQNPKKPLSLASLLENKTISDKVAIFIHRYLDDWLQIITDEQLHLCMDIDSKAVVHLTQLTLNPTVLQPQIYFERISDGLIYRLRISENQRIWRIQDNPYLLICNDPAWIVRDKQLYRLEGINSARLKPFFSKDELHIAQKNLKEYCKTIILPLVEKVDFEHQGFDIISYNTILKAELSVFHNFLNHSYGFSLTFDYGKSSFYWKDTRLGRSFLEFTAEEKVLIHHVKRNKASEQVYIQHLQQFGLHNQQSNYFEFASQQNDTIFSIIDWLLIHQKSLEQQGFTIAAPILEEKTIALLRPQLNLTATQENDWFDLKGHVIIGIFTIPFGQFIPHIRDNNPYFLLPDGKYFIIPMEWMQKYKGIAQLGKIQHHSVRITKSQAPALLDKEMIEVTEYDNDPIDWTPSPYLKATLRPYQEEGVRWLLKHYKDGLGACLADDMGLGKTLQTIAVLLYAKENKKTHSLAASSVQMDIFDTPPRSRDYTPQYNMLQPLQALIVLPASLVYNWESELKKFAQGIMIYLHIGNKRHKDIRLIQRFDVVLTTYQTVSRDIDLLEKIEWEYVVLDESQYIKNKNSDTFKAVNRLRTAHKISLSGTPIENSLSELWAQMQFINPDVLGSFASFDRHFIKPIEKNQDETQKNQLRNLIKPYLLRRTKNEVARDLPELSRHIVYSVMGDEQRKIYEKEKSSIRNLLLGGTQISKSAFEYNNIVIQSLNRLRLLAIHPALVIDNYQGDSAKFTDVIAKWEETRLAGYKMLVFSFFVKNLNLYRTYFDTHSHPYTTLTGADSLDEREQAKEDFNTQKNIQTLLISLKAGGTGLNLTAADYVFILDPWWNPAAEEQAISRAHRIGQTKPVVALKFITKDTIEEKILQLQQRKSQLVQDIIEEVAEVQMSKNELVFLLE